MKKNSNFLWGIVFIIIGILWALKSLEIININFFFDGWWTLFIIVPSLIGLVSDNEKTENLIGLIIGFIFLLISRDILDFGFIFKLIVPLVLVIVGISLICKDSLNQKIKKEIKKINKKDNHDNKEYFATFAGQELNFSEEDFSDCSLNAIFGGMECDLRNSQIQDKTLIKATAVFGGIDILVPDDVLVKVVSTSIFGGVSNKKKTSDSKKILYIEATCLFGGIDIK